MRTAGLNQSPGLNQSVGLADNLGTSLKKMFQWKSVSQTGTKLVQSVYVHY